MASHSLMARFVAAAKAAATLVAPGVGVFNFHVPSNALPKQTAPAAIQTAKNTKLVFNFMAADEAGISNPGQSYFQIDPKVTTSC